MHHSTFPDLSARDLLAVQVLSECRSFMAASLTLNVSQPALTRTIQRVEEVVGLELFRRSTRRVEITAAGTEFAAVASRILSDLRISLENMRNTADVQRGQLIVACAMSFANLMAWGECSQIYSPVNAAGRRSTKCATPSLKSALRILSNIS